MATFASSSISAPWPFLSSTRTPSSPLLRACCTMHLQRHTSFICRMFPRLWCCSCAQAWPLHSSSHSSVQGISLVGYCSQTLIRALCVMTECSSTRALVHLLAMPRGFWLPMLPGQRGGYLFSCLAGIYASLVLKNICQMNIVTGLVSGFSVGMAAQGSVGPTHARRRKRSVVQFPSTAKSQSLVWVLLWVPVVLTHSPGAGKSALFCTCIRHISFASHFMHHTLRSQQRIPPLVVSKVSRRSLLRLALEVQ